MPKDVAFAAALAPPPAKPLPEVADRLVTAPLVETKPAVPAAPVEVVRVAEPILPATPTADALDVAVWILSAVPVPLLAAPETVVVDPPVAVVTAAFETVAVATPVASNTAKAKRFFFIQCSFNYLYTSQLGSAEHGFLGSCPIF